MEPVQLWVFFKIEVTTDSGLSGHYWMAKLHKFLVPPYVGLELDYRTTTGHTVKLERVLLNPETGEYQAIQDSWISIGAGELTLWEYHGWAKVEMHEDDTKH